MGAEPSPRERWRRRSGVAAEDGAAKDGECDECATECYCPPLPALIVLVFAVTFAGFALWTIYEQIPVAAAMMPGEVVLRVRGGPVQRGRCVDRVGGGVLVPVRPPTARCATIMLAIADVKKGIVEARRDLEATNSGATLVHAVARAGFGTALRADGALATLRAHLLAMLRTLTRGCFPPLFSTTFAVAEEFRACDGNKCRLAVFSRVSYVGIELSSRITLSPRWFDLPARERADVLTHECLHKANPDVGDLLYSFEVCVARLCTPMPPCTPSRGGALHQLGTYLPSSPPPSTLTRALARRAPCAVLTQRGYRHLSLQGVLRNADSLVTLFNKIRTPPRDGAEMDEAEDSDDDYEYGFDEYVH